MTMIRTTLKKMLLVFLAAILMMPALFANGAKADTSRPDCSLVTMEFSLRRNPLLAKWGITVYLDGAQVCHIDQGELATLNLLVPHGNHHLLFVPDNNQSESYTWELSLLHDEYVLECRLQTHRYYIEMKSHSVKADSRTLTEEMQKKINEWKIKISDAIPFIDVSAEFSGNF